MVVNDHYSFDLDSPKPNLAMTDDDAAPGIDLTARLGKGALDLAPDAHAFTAADNADLAFCEASTAPLENIGTNDVPPHRSFCVNTGSGAWFWLKIAKPQSAVNPGTITLLIDRMG